MKILAIVPPYSLAASRKTVIPSKAMLPVGMLCIVSGLKQLGCEVQVCDLVFELNWQTKLSRTLKRQFDVILLSCNTARNIPAVSQVIRLVRAKLGDVRIVLGGNLCSQLGCKDFSQLDLKIDAVVRGYGHGALVEILEAQGDIWPKTVPRELPIPELSLLDQKTHKLYHQASGGQYPIVGTGGFGCRHRCAYCLAHQNSNLMPRDFANLEHEVKQAAKFGYEQFWCVDNLCFAHPTEALRFDQLITSLNASWKGMCRPEDITNLNHQWQPLKQFTALKEIAIGVEWVSRQTLDGMKRGCSRSYLKQIREALNKLQKAKIISTVFVILDAPQSSETDFWQLRRFLKSAKPDYISWSFFNPEAQTILQGERRSEDFGFYHWPFGLSAVSPQRAVQHAMILSGESWCGWQVNEDNPYYEDTKRIGVNFQGRRWTQVKTARTATGNLWEVWQEEAIA